ncbi:MAG: M14 family metallopeptidase [Thermoplasmata archaeon]|nr:M14 family metallopeptidase [Thermoplasmata archaeon]
MGVGESSRSPSNDSADWRTPAESDDYRSTPDYPTTIEYLERISSKYPETVRIENFGKTGEGRDLKIVIASKGGLFDPARIRAAGRVILLVQNSIHAGEMDGKDACLALLRDILQGGAGPLENVVLVFIPVYNIDGHEHRSPYTRINQNGPALAGWRANATNLNLNRDYMKADAPETRAFLQMLHRWMPDFFVDNHVTDGADFQYDVTFALDSTTDVFPPTARWIREFATPELTRRTNETGHLTFPGQIFLNDESDPSQGLKSNDNPPRFSTGFMILENRPGLLVELHMLKSYKTRVTADYELMRVLLEILNENAATLIALNAEADRAAATLGGEPMRQRPFPLCVGKSGQNSPVPFLGFEFTREHSQISDSMMIRYSQKPWNTELPMDTGNHVQISIRPPAGYIVPPQWTHVIEVLEAHGVATERTNGAWTGTVERYRCSGMHWPSRPFEGRYPILRGGNVERDIGEFGRCTVSTETLTFPAGSAVVPLNQRLSKVAIHWLEPEAPDSALRWGFFDSIFEQKESGDAYVLEKLARDELVKEPSLREAFDHRLQSDPHFAGDSRARLEFFYDRSPWGLANRIGDYPVGRLSSLSGLP